GAGSVTGQSPNHPGLRRNKVTFIVSPRHANCGHSLGVCVYARNAIHFPAALASSARRWGRGWRSPSRATGRWLQLGNTTGPSWATTPEPRPPPEGVALLSVRPPGSTE